MMKNVIFVKKMKVNQIKTTKYFFVIYVRLVYMCTVHLKMLALKAIIVVIDVNFYLIIFKRIKKIMKNAKKLNVRFVC